MTSRKAAVCAGLPRHPEPEAGRRSYRGHRADVPHVRVQPEQAGLLQALGSWTRRRRWRQRCAEGVWRKWRSRRGG